MIPARADRCAYVLYKDNREKGGERTASKINLKVPMSTEGMDMDAVLEQILDPITGSPAKNKTVLGVACLHVDDLLLTGCSEFYEKIVGSIRKDYQKGSEDKDDVVFTGQRLRWQGPTLVCDQERAIERSCLKFPLTNT